jgi:MOSC domain-containing protein YiiM
VIIGHDEKDIRAPIGSRNGQGHQPAEQTQQQAVLQSHTGNVRLKHFGRKEGNSYFAFGKHTVATVCQSMSESCGQVAQIQIAISPASEMVPVASARAVPGYGLEGDRYFTGIGTFSPQPQKPDFELTLIEEENVSAFAGESSLHFTPAMTRRNVVTRGVRLNDLAGREFFIGTVRLRGVRLCEPCNHLAKRTLPEVLTGLVHKGGLRAQILSEGRIRVGDNISPAT